MQVINSDYILAEKDMLNLATDGLDNWKTKP